jgi:RNA polymerase sigma factor (sigma-70 family)
MELTQAFEDKEVRQLLNGGEADLAEAFARIDAFFRNRFVLGARKRLPRLPPEDLADAWQETLRDLLQSLRAGRFDPDRKLGPWLWTVFIRRAFDGLRRKNRHGAMLEQARRQLQGTETGAFLERLDEEERIHLLGLVRQAVGTLPARQRTVIQLFVEHFPATEDLELLRQRVSEATGVEETRAGVKRALEEARRKIAGLLQRRAV